MTCKFDKKINREDNKYSYSIKWDKKIYPFENGEAPKDRFCFQIADLDFETAPQIIKDLKKCAHHGVFGYSKISDEYYEAVINWNKRHYNLETKKEEIFVSRTGTHSVIQQVVARLTEVGDYVLVLTPSYNYHKDIEPQNRKFLKVDMINTNGYYTIDFENLEKKCKKYKPKLFILCNPHNPTGRVFNKDELSKLNEICLKYNIFVLADEVHSDLIRFKKEFTTSANILNKDNLILCTAINKTFNLAGLAVTNYFIFNKDIREKFLDIEQLASPFGMTALISAYTKCDKWVEELNSYLDASIKEEVDFINNNLEGVKCFLPEASYIVWLDFSESKLTKEQLDDLMINKCHILDRPGEEFDAPYYFRRFCLASPKKEVMNGLKKLKEEFDKLKQNI